jgi:predicted RNase H-like nuclease (RuvC/YqgF family)
MAESLIIKELQREGAELRERIDQFRQLLNSVLELRTLDPTGLETKSRMVNSMSQAEIAPHLREVSLRCQSLARESTDAGATRGLQEAGIELADQAIALETILANPTPGRSP